VAGIVDSVIEQVFDLYLQFQVDIAEHPVDIVFERHRKSIEYHSSEIISLAPVWLSCNVSCRRDHHAEDHDFEPPVPVSCLADVERVEHITEKRC
jgi:hypothetical protein